jgi:GT2 family glycosyltransferase
MTAAGDTGTARDRPFVPVPVVELDLADPAAAPLPNALGQIVLLVRIHGVPLGTLSLLATGEAADVDLRAMASETFVEPLARHLAADGADPAGEPRGTSPDWCGSALRPTASSVSVVVCTIGEDPRLVQTVRSILDQTHHELELIVVDNRPASGKVGRLLEGLTDPRLRLVPQPRIGLSAARNAGAAAASGDLVMYTDDDAFAEPDWVRSLAQPFDEHPSVVCTTGLVLPAEIATPAQAWFEEFGGFDKGFVRKVWTAGPERPELASLGERGEGGILFPFSAGVFGSGNNMAFRRAWLGSHALFDEALGAGTVTRGGEDLDAFLTVMLTGGVLVYEPRAIVRHHARGDMAALGQQMYGYGSGMSAVIAKHLVQSPRTAAQILRRVPAGVHRLVAPGSEKNAGRSTGYPRNLVRAEMSGYLLGPALYARSRRTAARQLRTHPHLARPLPQ